MMTQLQPPPFSISPAALNELTEMRKVKNVPESFHVRVGVKEGAGCQGVNFMLGFDLPLPSDTVYQLDDLKFVVDKGHVMHVVGMTINYHQEDHSKGFVFEAEHR